MKNFNFAKSFLFALLLFIATAKFSVAQEEPAPLYRISKVIYSLQGRTNEETLKNNIKIDREKVFASKEEFENYINYIQGQIENTRLFEQIYVFYTVDTEISLFIQASEASNMLILPKPSYSSNSGAELEIKLKDKNFLGKMNPLDFDIEVLLGTEDEPDDFSKVTLGTNFEYTYPFIFEKTENEWSNILSFSWLLGESKPEFSFETGLKTTIPLAKSTAVELHFTQSLIQDFDYMEFEDAFYFVDECGIALPLKIGEINYKSLLYTPFTNFTHNWDQDGISSENKDLVGPYIEVGHKIENENVNWKGNFRNGWDIEVSQSFIWNFKRQVLNPKVTGELTLFKAFKYFAVASSLYGYAMVEEKENTCGERLRGILDKEKFKNSEIEALSSQTAIALSLDFPIHILTTDWLGWSQSLFGTRDSFSLLYKIFEYTDFEIQFSPFTDIALTKNTESGRLFSIKDGFYTAGFEILVYPKRWKSFVVRLSSGWDLSRSLLKEYLDTSWRRSETKKHEIYFGLSLQY